MKLHNLLLAAVAILMATWTVTTFAEPAGQADPAVGQFSGSMKVTGVMKNGQLKTDPKCTECHAQATVRLEQSAYVMDLEVKNSGNKKPEVVKLAGKTEDGKLIFKNEKYCLSLVDGKLLIGKRIARMQGNLELVSLPTTQPVAMPTTQADRQVATSRPETPTAAPATGIRRVHVFVSGRVQAVGFRAFTASNAQRLKLAGWVTNLSDGRVEMVAEGPAEQIDKLLKIVRVGPSTGRVDKMETADEKPSPGELGRFEIRQ